MGFKCDRCPKEFPANNRLRRHLRQVHKFTSIPEKYGRRSAGKFPCDLCHKAYVRKFQLQLHIDAVHLQKSSRSPPRLRISCFGT